MMYFVLLVLLVGTVAAQTTEGRRTLCGRELARAHYLYCYGMDRVPDDSAEMKTLIAESEKSRSAKMPGRFSFRLRRAAGAEEFTNVLVETCCLKPCHINQLLEHC